MQDLRFFMVKLQVVFWFMTLCSDVVGYQCFGGPWHLYLEGEVNGTGKGGIDALKMAL
jgi:hypothetical protein